MKIVKSKDGNTGKIILNDNDFPPTKEIVQKMIDAFPPDEYYLEKELVPNHKLLKFTRKKPEEILSDTILGIKPEKSVDDFD